MASVEITTPRTSSAPLPTKAALLATLAVTAAAVAAFLWRRPDTAIEPRFAAGYLFLFSGLFLLRVVGQLYVRLRRPAWLPPTEDWNLTPYRLLLPVQLAILGLMVWLDASLASSSGPPADPTPGLGEAVLVLSYVYAGTMAVRYVVRMTRRPEQRWFGGAIPIVFHLVLASYLYVFGSYHASY